MKYIVRSITGGIEKTVIVSSAVEQDGCEWVHVSVAKLRELPSWDDLVEAKDVLVGPEAEAYQVIPAKSRHVNIHPNCLHIFSRVSGPALPDFTRGSGSL